MKLRRLYSNRPALFAPIAFHDGLNVVLGEIRRPENRDKDTHNLGKSTLAQVIDFCLLRKREPDFFLFREGDRFEEFVFFLELETHDQRRLTIRRSVARASKLAFMYHDGAPGTDLSSASDDAWDHWDVPFERSKELLDGALDLRAIAPWNFRNVVGYLLRSQRDYDEPFKLAKYGGRHATWKPFLAHLLGLDHGLVSRGYELGDDIETERSAARRIQAELEGRATNLDQVRGLVDIAQREVSEIETQLDTYNFEIADADINRELVEELDTKIAELNESRYYLSTTRARIEDSLTEHVVFDLDRVRRIFEQAEIYFSDQVVVDYQALEAFNRSISEERNQYLREELAETMAELERTERELSELNSQRASALLALRDKDTFSKYKRLSTRLSDRRVKLETLRQHATKIEKHQLAERRIRELQKEKEAIQEALEANIEQPGERYHAIRRHFDEVVHSVIDRHANLFTLVNNEGNIEFRAEIVDDSGDRTSAGEGYTYGRLLCIAFDMAVMKAYADAAYPHFVYHDGALEALDDRKKLNLLEAIRESSRYGTQHVITLIDSELPALSDGTRYEFPESEIVLRLHDEGDDGRLFRMGAW
jgi:uncharacterized protein YydD (DUF2326 family)